MSTNRSVAQRKIQRSPRFLAMSFALLALWSAAANLPAVEAALSLDGSDVVTFGVASFVALCLSSASFHAFGPYDARYLVFAVLESATYVTGLMTLIYRSRPDSLFWLIYTVVASLHGSIGERRGPLRFAVGMPPMILAGCYIGLRGDYVAAGIVLVAGLFALLAFEIQALTADRLDEQTRAYEAAQRELAESRLVQDRQRIARDLHDGIGADLSAIALRAERLLAERDDADELRTISTRAAQGIDDLRTIVWALKEPQRPWADVAGYLAGRLSELAPPSTRVEVEVVPSGRVLSGEEASHVIRAVEEATRNAIRHAQASVVHVRLAAEPAWCLEVSDDGRGMPTAARRRSGLAHLEARAVALGARLRVEGRSPGTRVVIEAAPGAGGERGHREVP